MHDQSHSLSKENPGQLFSFEEKVFGVLTLSQLLSDIGAGALVLSLTQSLPLWPRLVIGVLLGGLLLVLLHVSVQGRTLLLWLLLWGRFLLAPKEATWQSEQEPPPDGKRPAALQTTWIPLNHLEAGLAGYAPPGAKGTAGRYWAVLEVEGQPLRYLPEAEQIKAFARFESFLCGLQFRLQFLSLCQQVDPAHYPPLQAQQQALAARSQTPRLAALQQATIQYQQRHLNQCTLTRHFVVISVTAAEEVARLATQGESGLLLSGWRMLFGGRSADLSQEEILQQLRVRVSVVKRLLQQLDVQSHLLADAELLRHFVSCLALGVEAPSFLPEPVAEQAPLVQAAEEPGPAPRTAHLFTRRMQGLHRPLLYQSRQQETHLETGAFQLADLIAPSRVEVAPDVLNIKVRGRKRFQRYITIEGYGHQLRCGWMEALTELGLPMLISTVVEPLDAQWMINRLELQLVRLESHRLADEKHLRLGRASRLVEAEQIRAVTRSLAAGALKIFAVQMTIGLHASTLPRLEQRTRYLLSHLRQMQVQARVAVYQQAQVWQAMLPVCAPPAWDRVVNLPSDTLSSFLHLSSGAIGAPTGVFIGFVGTGIGRRPVFLNPWSEEKPAANPHMVIVGESGMGKSFTGKVLVSGMMAQGLADCVVLDRDDDYLPLHRYLGEESQRYNLARGCPINFFDLPYAPSDVDPDDPSDLLAEFIDNHLLAGLTLLLCDADTRLSKSEEAYLMHVARCAYAQAGITSEAIRSLPDTLLLSMPTLADFIAVIQETPAHEPAMQQSLLERLQKAAYLFSGPTSISIDKPLTIFSIHELDEKWYGLMSFTVQNFLLRHRALHQHERYLAYVVEEASYMLKHPAGRKYLEVGSRGFRKLGIAQITLSQHPNEFLVEGAVIMNNCGTACMLGMQPYAASLLQLPEELKQIVTAAVPGQMVLRVGKEFAAVTVAASPLHRALFDTTPQVGRKRDERKGEGA